jgi:hypothetical protein
MAPFQMDRIISGWFWVLGGEPLCGCGSWRKGIRNEAGVRSCAGGARDEPGPHGEARAEGVMVPRALSRGPRPVRGRNHVRKNVSGTHATRPSRFAPAVLRSFVRCLPRSYIRKNVGAGSRARSRLSRPCRGCGFVPLCETTSASNSAET